MKKLLFILLGVLVLGCFLILIVTSHIRPDTDQEIEKLYAVEKSWPHIPYVMVKAYLYNLDYHEDTPNIPNPNIIENGQLVKSVANKEGILLSTAQVQKLLSASSLIPPHHNGITTLSESMCIFNPHHAFVFYDSHGTPVATMELCTFCEDIVFSPERKNYCRYDFDALDTLIKELGMPVFHNDADLDAYLKSVNQVVR